MMPYIEQEVRDDYDKKTIKWFREAMVIRCRGGIDSNPQFAGDMNWLISSILWAAFDANPSYRRGNEIVGILESAKQEFYRRKLTPYEDGKILENGDL